MKLTPYGPGKFRCLVDVIAYSYTVAGAHDDETGDAETVGWFGRVSGALDSSFADASMLGGKTLAPFDVAFLAANVGGAIVSEDSAGFVSVDWFRTEADGAAEWERIVERVSDALAEQEAEES